MVRPAFWSDPKVPTVVTDIEANFKRAAIVVDTPKMDLRQAGN